MKVGIIGGGGIVGASAGFALQLGGIVHEIVIVDVNADLADGQALDMMHGAPAIADQVITSGAYEDLADADLICITAGLRRKPDESRLALINRNVALFKTILQSVKEAGIKSDATILVVSNPVDILTYLAEDALGLPQGRVIGLGTLLDTLRFRSLLALNLHAPATQVSAIILGEHGDSMVPIWSSASVGGLPLEKYPGYTQKLGQDTFIRAKTSGAEMIKKRRVPDLLLVFQLPRLFMQSRLIGNEFTSLFRFSAAVMGFETLPSPSQLWLVVAARSRLLRLNSGQKKYNRSSEAVQCCKRHLARFLPERTDQSPGVFTRVNCCVCEISHLRTVPSQPPLQSC